jgi:hypothetical protein
MSPKKPTGFRIPKVSAEELKAIAAGPPLKPIRCTTRRVSKARRSDVGGSESTQAGEDARTILRRRE